MTTDTGSCCGPSRGESEPSGVVAEGVGQAAEPFLAESRRTAALPEMVPLDGGTFLMGAEGPECVPADHEGPVRKVEVSAFFIDPCAVSNRRFAEFIDATNYATDAERYGWSFVFGGLLPDEFEDTPRRSPGAVVAPGPRCLLAPARGASLVIAPGKPARSSGSRSTSTMPPRTPTT